MDGKLVGRSQRNHVGEVDRGHHRVNAVVAPLVLLGVNTQVQIDLGGSRDKDELTGFARHG